jgi:raffinose/stachyose/melibiose transport system permease protein
MLPTGRHSIRMSSPAAQVRGGPPWRARLRRREGPRRTPLVWALPGLALVLTFHYVAVGAGAWYAFTDWNGITSSANFIGLRNFRTIFTDPVARSALWHTLEISAAFVVVVNAIGLGLALALYRALKTRHVLRALFFAPVLMSSLAVSYVWQFIFSYDGPLNRVLAAVGLGSYREAWIGSPRWALWTIFVVLVWQFAGLSMTFYLAGLQRIPEELDEAGGVDGASAFQRFRWITLPLLAPAMTISFTYSLITGLRVFDQVIALTGGGPVGASETLATQVYEQTFAYGHFGYGAAFALVLTLIIAVAGLTQLAVLRRREERI